MSETSRYDIPIQYIDRQSGELETEDVYGEGFLRWAYGNPLGRLTVKLAVKRIWFSRWYGWRMDLPKSYEKVPKFIDDYNVDTSEFLEEATSFKTFNEFFYRKLKPKARPIEEGENIAVFPADGRHLLIPDVSSAKCFYIKGQQFNLEKFLGCPELASQFQGGTMVISRLCPVDYHRYHFPVSGVASSPVLMGSTLRSVSPLALRRQLAILWENRRSRTLVRSKVFGDVAVMEIGATCVGGMHQTFSNDTFVHKGNEKGYFSFGGSCVTTVFQKGALVLDSDLLDHAKNKYEVYSKMGEKMGEVGRSI